MVSEKQLKIEQKLTELMIELGYSNSELATEELACNLNKAVFVTLYEIEKSHNYGLGLNTIPTLARELIKHANI